MKFYFLETSRKLSTLYNKEDYSPNKLDFLNEMNLSLVFASVNCTHNIPPTINPLWLEILGEIPLIHQEFLQSICANLPYGDFHRLVFDRKVL